MGVFLFRFKILVQILGLSALLYYICIGLGNEALSRLVSILFNFLKINNMENIFETIAAAINPAQTFDIYFSDDNDSSNKGFRESLDWCKDYITIGKGTNYSSFSDYKGGTVMIVCNETGQTVHEEEIN